jgi:hypothetical protein
MEDRIHSGEGRPQGLAIEDVPLHPLDIQSFQGADILPGHDQGAHPLTPRQQLPYERVAEMAGRPGYQNHSNASRFPRLKVSLFPA